ncbi:hypothetical protein [Tomitella cavernea]|uniref:Uncharacterized protein n=1 Tax=Tomitella cavernea TaxID=1387982 RepID=A0ABP9CEJ4_9ACTN|nr:hypothetical protein [Tomitella cavernea]
MDGSGTDERRGRLSVDRAEVDAVLRALGASTSDARAAAEEFTRPAAPGVAETVGDPALGRIDEALRQCLVGALRGEQDWAATVDACAQYIRRTVGAATDADAEVATGLRSVGVGASGRRSDGAAGPL